MTQTITTPNDLFPMTGMVTWSPTVGVRLRYFPMQTVDRAREEYGPTLADAQAFVQGVCCTECGEEKETTTLEFRECRGCGERGCGCALAEDPHGRDVFWCSGCNPRCSCRECEG